uniref:Uncharacterized protein n=1 Tax=Cucumis sativus TaxID=3659 RepID=A0A0A0LB37_CUCSA
MKPTNLPTEILYINVIGSQQKVQSVLGIYRQRPGFRGHSAFNHRLNGQPSQRFPMGVKTVILLFSKADRPGNVGSSLVGVELNSPPPAKDRRGFGIMGRDGVDELTNDFLLISLPRAVPDNVNGYISGENRAHVVLQMDELRRALVFFGVANESGVIGDVRFGEMRPRTPCGSRREEEKEEGESS